jgi:hypothetical protein
VSARDHCSPLISEPIQEENQGALVLKLLIYKNSLNKFLATINQKHEWNACSQTIDVYQ